METNTTTNDISTIFSNYVKKALLDAGRGMKSLLVDEDTLAIVNNAMNQTDVLKRDVFAVEPLRRNTNRTLGKEEVPSSSSSRRGGREEDNLRFVKAVCILRPTSENVNALCERIRESGDASSSSSSYGEFHVFFYERDRRAQTSRDCESGRERRKRG